MLQVVQPFYGLFLIGFNKVRSAKIPTMGVQLKGNRYELVFNEEWWNTLTDKEQIAVLMHELGHVMYQHCELYKDLTNHEVANIAMDGELNLHIPNLPEGCVDTREWKKEYPDYELEKGTRYNYRWLMQFAKDGNQGERMSSQGSGSPMEGNGQDGEINSKFGKNFDDHSGLEDAGKLSPEQQQVVRGIVESQMVEAAGKCVGNVPQHVQQLLDEIQAKTHVEFSWKNYFRRLVGNVRTLLLKKTHKRDSKRFSENPGKRHITTSKLLIAVDCSGSVSDSDLNEIYSEVAYIQKQCNTEIDVLQFDTEVADVTRFNPKQKVQVKARGGTDFEPAFNYFNLHREYDILIMITDGYSEIDNLHARGDKCIWVITDPSNKQSYPGYTVYFNSKS